MKNSILIAAYLFLFCSISLAQEADPGKIIYLKDGSFFLGKILNNQEDSLLQIELTGGNLLTVSNSTIHHIDDQKKGMKMLADGRKVKESGYYFSIGTHSLTARQARDFPQTLRWSTGMHFSSGHIINRYIGIGAGAGIDLHEKVFIPIYLEATGHISSNKTPHRGILKRQIPLTYSLQVGYNIPVNEKNNDFEELTGGWLVYPAIGFLLSSRRGPNFKLDIGYKFQHYHRTFTSDWWWNDYQSEDSVLLKSLAIRGSLIF